MRFSSLGSGSRGNALIVESSQARILIDCGVAFRPLRDGLARLDISLDSIDAVFITHEHSDHIKGLKSLARQYAMPLYMTHGTAIKSGLDHLPQMNILSHFSPVAVGDLLIQPVTVPHDAREPCQFVISTQPASDQAAKKLGILTDLGSYTPHIIESYQDCDAIILECNYDESMLKNGPYPMSLKQRVKGDWGHLSNTQAAELLSKLQHQNIQWLVLAHISQKNNQAALACEAIKAIFPHHERMRVADQESGFDWLEIA